MKYDIKFSIITVVYNSASTIEKTILSVIDQQNTNLEYIIIDGGSTDGTVEIIKKYSSRIGFWISEKDNGIYDAMNKGILKCTGQWINFMNSGDFFCHSNVLNDVSKAIKASNIQTDILYGNSVVIYSDNQTKHYSAAPSIVNQWKGPVFRHGAMFVKTELHKKHLFNLDKRYKICADFDLIYKLQFLGFRFDKVDIDILYFQHEGASSNRVRCAIDNKHIVLSYTPKFSYWIWHNFWIIRAWIIDNIITHLK